MRTLTGTERVRAERLDHALLEHAQQLRLHGERDLRDLVEQQRSAVGRLEAPFALSHGAREGAALVTEQLRLDERLGERRAVDRDERRALARATRVERVRDQLLAGAALAADEHGRIALRDGVDALDELLHRRACAR